MFKKVFTVLSLLLLTSAVSVSAEDLRAEIKYSPVQVDVHCDCNNGKIDIPVYKLGLEGRLYRGAKLGLRYEGSISEGDGHFDVGNRPALNHTAITNVTYSNFEIYAKLPFDRRKWSDRYQESDRENNFYGNLLYKNTTLETMYHPRTRASFKRFFEKASGMGVGLGYDGYFSDKLSFETQVNYFPSMSSSAPPPMEASFKDWAYKFNLRYDFNNSFGVTAGYEGESHYYKNNASTYYRGIVFGLQGRW